MEYQNKILSFQPLLWHWCLQVGDGTTSVVLLAGEFLKQAKPYVEENVHPQVLVRAYRKAASLVGTDYQHPTGNKIINSNDCSQKQFLTNGQRFSKAKQINYSVKSMNIRRKILGQHENHYKQPFDCNRLKLSRCSLNWTVKIVKHKNVSFDSNFE